MQGQVLWARQAGASWEVRDLKGYNAGSVTGGMVDNVRGAAQNSLITAK